MRLRGLLAAHRDSAVRDAAHLDELAFELERALLLAREAVPADVVVMDSWVQVLDLLSGEQREYTLTYPADSNPGRSHFRAGATGHSHAGLTGGDEVEC